MLVTYQNYTKMYGQKNIKLGNCSVQTKEDGHVARTGEKRVLVRNPKTNRPL